MKDLKLAEFQRLFKQAVVSPFCAAPGAPAPEDLGARGHFEVYTNAYGKRLTSSLAEDFPTLFEKLGHAEFEKLASQYLAAHPSRFWTIAEVSRNLPGFLRQDHRWKARQDLAEIAEEDWLEDLAFIAPEPSEENRVTPAELQNGLAPGMILRTHPSVHFASRDAGDVRIAWKKDREIFLNTLSHAEAHLLRELQAGMPILELLKLLEGAGWDETRVQQIFSEWTADGILLIEKESLPHENHH